MKAVYFAATAALALGACNRTEADRDSSAGTNSAAADAANVMAAPPPALPGDAGVTTDPSAYVARAGEGDQFEIESSRAVLAKTKNADVRRFAQMMIDEHQASTAQIKQAAATDKVEVPTPVMTADQENMLAEIKAADAASADRVYLQHQRTAHTAALTLHQGFAHSDNGGKLKTVADQIAGAVQKHLTALDRVEGSVIGANR